jgi:3-hydroxyacyl-[acyl-carrier-protein] dehydratase
MSVPALPIEIEGIKKILPHRRPFLFVDRIIALEPDKRIVGIKNVTSDERYFIAGPGGVPVLPASILTEAMAQVGSVALLQMPENRGKIPFFAGIDGIRFKRPVRPGDVLRMEVGAVLVLSKPENRSRVPYFMGIDRVRYRRPVRAGDTVELEGIVLRMRAKMGSFRGIARVDGVVVCEGQMTFALGDATPETPV